MPHSSGGGSHGGGSHGGGHHGGGSRGPSPTRISRTPYPGARRFRYRTRRGYRYFYTTREPGKIFHPARLLVGLIYLPFIATGVHEIAEPVQRATQKYDREIVVIDDAYVLGDESKLMTSLNAFSERTQITPAVITLYNEDWKNYYVSLEDYAYDRYLTEFKDEYHWLIVYSSPREVSIADAESGNVEWYWEGMQGDYTDPVLTDYVTGQFNQSFQSALEAGDKSVSDSLASAFDTATVNAGTLSRQVHFSDMFMGFFMLGFIAFHAFFFLGLNELKYRKAELDPDDPGIVPDPLSRFNPPQFGTLPQQPFDMQQQQQFGAQPQAFGAQPQAFGAQPQAFGAQPQGFGTQSQAFGTQPQGFGAQPQGFGAQPQTFGAQPQQFGTQPQAFGTQPQAFGTQPQAFGTQPQQFGTQPQQFGVQPPAPEPAAGNFEMPELLTAPPEPESRPFEAPQFEMPQFDAPAQEEPQFDAQQQQFDLQQEQFAQQQRQFDMHQQQFGMPAPQPAAPAFKIPEFPQPSAQSAKEACRFCGAHYYPGIKYCPVCGAEVSDSTD